MLDLFKHTPPANVVTVTNLSDMGKSNWHIVVSIKMGLLTLTQSWRHQVYLLQVMQVLHLFLWVYPTRDPNIDRDPSIKEL